MKDPVAAVELALGMRFRRRETVLQALTHRSWVNENQAASIGDNERLEFLGDAVLDLAMSQRLMERFPEATEGTLSKLRASLVDELSLSLVAKDLGLGELLLLGRGEEVSGGREKPSLLANALEAVLAAIYLEGGLPPVFQTIDRFFGAALQKVAAGNSDRDYKTQLQEQAQKRFLGLPSYRVAEERGPEHRKTFTVEVDVGGRIHRGVGLTKKDAERLAAKAALDELD